MEQVIEKLHTVEEDVNKLKNELKKLPSTENMAKDADMKKLKQQVERLQTQQQKRMDHVANL